MNQTSNSSQSRTENIVVAGAVIDASGEEIEITEQMIQHACALLAEELPNHHAEAANSQHN